jgi:hypothetical protein
MTAVRTTADVFPASSVVTLDPSPRDRYADRSSKLPDVRMAGATEFSLLEKVPHRAMAWSFRRARVRRRATAMDASPKIAKAPAGVPPPVRPMSQQHRKSPNKYF